MVSEVEADSAADSAVLVVEWEAEEELEEVFSLSEKKVIVI